MTYSAQRAVAALALTLLAGSPLTGATPAHADPDEPCQNCDSGTVPPQPGDLPGAPVIGGGQHSVGGGGKMGQAPPPKPPAPVNP
ncbi:hypothetical protein [Mycobacterium paraterrae]|uniref:Uncharacterized protein n=1 Tax=Mycobacterium paraterrae TaxID=577492 RepID=A0ABY3VRL0_9MYCO|nr:hypothetical protein [Mycobacterium paraterrae]UMB69812.1 hypothetical protein MKK62_00050 [Mycobacterium paraterrae]